MSHMEYYTLTEIARAMRLKAKGRTWAQIGGELDREPQALATAVWRHRHGQNVQYRTVIKPQIEAQARRMEELAEQGASIQEIAEALDLKYHTAYARLRRLGFDAETIAAFRSTDRRKTAA